MMKPLFTQIPFFVYPVTDMARARAFYHEILELPETANWEDKWVEFSVGKDTLAISVMSEGQQPGAKAGAIALEADDFDNAVRHLRGRGVRFVAEPHDTGVCLIARFEDPDGNQIILHRRNAAAD